VVVHAPQGVVVERRDRAVERQDLQTVPGQLQLADDLRPKQRDHVGVHREPEPGEDLLRHGGPAQNVPALQNQDPLARFGQVRGGREAVVSAADDDDVVPLGHRPS
jgi:hypothetical protein